MEGIYTTETEYDNHVVVDVHANGAQDLKALYFTMEYDSENYRPMRIEPTDAMGHKDDLLTIELRTTPGEVVYGQCLTNPDWREGLSGDATVASVMFRKEPCPIVKNVSYQTAPDSGLSVTTLVIDTDTDLATWYYWSQGDYNQDGLVLASDMTTVGQRWGNSSGGGPFDPTTANSACDGNNNGLIEVGDITPIGQNYENNALGGYNMYVGGVDDVPTAYGEDNGAGTLVANIEFTALLGAATTDRLHHEYTIAAPVPGGYYWVRPIHSNASMPEGIPSNGVQYSNVPKATLALTNPPAGSEGGTGPSDRYVVDVTTDYIFSLTDPTDGDVTNDANTVYVVSDPAVGTIATADATLNIENAYFGDFTVSATYNGIASDNTIYFHVDEPPEEQIWIMPDSTDTDWGSVPSGDGTDGDRYVLLTDTFNATGTMEFTLDANTLQDGSGDPIAVADLTWDAVPPFIVFWDGVNVSTFTVHFDDTSGTPISLCNGYIYAEDSAMERSQNDLYVQSQLMP